MTTSIRSSANSHIYLRLDGAGVTQPTGSGGGTVNCQYYDSGVTVTGYEVFTLFPVGNYVAFQSVAWPQGGVGGHVYLRMDGTKVKAYVQGGGGKVNCQYYLPGTAPAGGVGTTCYEIFEIVNTPEGRQSIQSLAFPGVYLRMDGGTLGQPDPSGGGTVNCQFGNPNPTEQFSIITTS